jgi:diguanylate cyclase (GGDEF)-like protein
VVFAWVLLGGSVIVFAIAVPMRAGHPEQVLWLDVVDYGVAYLSAAALLLGQRVSDGRARWAWRCLGLAMVLYTVANVYFSLVLEHEENPPYPSIADAFYLAWYPLVAVAIVLLLFAHVHRFHPGMVLDGLAAGLGATAVTIAAVLGPAMSFSDQRGASRAELAVNLAYPLADLFLIMLLVAGGAMLGGGLTRAVVLVGLGLGLTAAGDTVYLVQDTAGSYLEGGPVDLLWLLGALALAAGPAVQSSDPSSASGQQEGQGEDSEDASDSYRLRVSRGLLAVPIVLTVASMAVVAMHQAGVVSWQAVPAADGALIAALLRAGVTFHEVRLVEGRKLARAHRQARTDDLTGLPNRRALNERCQALVAEAAATRTEVSLLMLDLDRFKEVNDSLGHTRGDELLIAVARRVRDSLDPDDELARLGGDEFAILTHGSRARAIVEQVLGAFGEPFNVAGVMLHVDVSIGVSTAPAPAATAAALLSQADVAMYRAKRHRQRVAVYASDNPYDGRDRLLATEELRAALADEPDSPNGRLLVHLQPQLRLTPGANGGAPGDVVGVEALVRWQHPTRGLLFPGSFLPLVGAAGMTGRLAELVLGHALAACAQWWSTDCPIPVAVNHTADDVLHPDLIDRIQAALERYRLPAAALVVELTEDTLMTGPAQAREALAAIRSLGARVSIDDYGSGYSSLAYLRTLPADELKLDRAFISDLAATPSTASPAAAIIRSTADLAHSLGLQVVAEGIEDATCLDLLAELGCDIGQGYHLATPMPVPSFLSWIQGHVGAPLHPLTTSRSGPTTSSLPSVADGYC